LFNNKQIVNTDILN